MICLLKHSKPGGIEVGYVSCRLLLTGRIAKSLFESLDHLFVDLFVRSIIEAGFPGLLNHVSVQFTSANGELRKHTQEPKSCD